MNTPALADRVRQCAPLRHPAFGSLLQLLSVEASEAVQTAAVTVGTRSRLLINPAFVAARCRTDEHLTMLVMHELYHVLLGHTRSVRRPTLAANWAFDCIVNAQLCRLHPGVAFTSFFSAGAAAEGPWSLIAPAPGWPTEPRYAAGALGQLHRQLYDDDGATTAELFALLEGQALALDPDQAGRLLGQHGDDASEGAEQDPLHQDPDLLAEVGRLVARWPMIERRGGVDDGEQATWNRSPRQRHQAARRAVAALLRQAARGASGGAWRQQWAPVEVLSAWPQPQDRRGQLLSLLGHRPLLWQGTGLHTAAGSTGQVAVYLDVSGSMAAWLPLLLDALDEAGALVRWPLYGFSTVVYPVSRRELAQGRFRSSGGTAIACVAQHLLDERIERAVLITDGAVQQVPQALVTRLRRARPRVRVGLLDGCDGSFGQPLGWAVTPLPRLDPPLPPSPRAAAR